MPIDQHYMTVAPVTWSAKCAICANVIKRGPEHRCKLERVAGPGRYEHCITMREAGARCGPGAALWLRQGGRET